MEASTRLGEKRAAFLLVRFCALCENQRSKRLRNMEIWHSRSRWPPCRIESRFARPFYSVKIHFPRRGRIKSLNKRLRRQCQFRDPRLAGFVQGHSASQAALQIEFFAWRDVQINPHPVRTNFEFLVASAIRLIRLKKDLSDVPLPESVTPSIGLSVRKNCDRTVLRSESQIE